MPANLTPEYLKAEQRYREAKTPEEKLAALQEMLRTIPKHKGTDKLQADIKRRISQTKKAIAQAKKASGYDPFAIPRQGAGQVILIGPPNSGKSSIVAALTSASVKVADWPFSTASPVPGMCWFEDVGIQLIDTPPLTAEHAPTGLAGAVRNADIVAPVIDLAADSALEDLEVCLQFIRQRRLEPVSQPDPPVPEDPYAPQPKRCLVLANKCDLGGYDLERCRAPLPAGMQLIPVSALTGEGLDRLGEVILERALPVADLEARAALNRRQEARIRGMRDRLSSIGEGREAELVARELRGALAELEELTGDRVGEAVLDEIFAEFCIGK